MQTFVNKIIFLDVDGVINHCDWYDWIHEHKEFLKAGGHDSIDPKAVDKIIQICNETNAYIVMSSSWRYWSLGHTIKKLNSIRDLRPILDRLVGVTPRTDKRNRGEEIKYFLNACRKRNMFTADGDMLSDERFKFDISPKYVILDDDTDMLPEQMNNFIHVNDIHGISDEDVKKAIDILNV